MGLCSAFIMDAFAGNFCCGSGQGGRKEGSRSHVNSRLCHDCCDRGISGLKYAQQVSCSYRAGRHTHSEGRWRSWRMSGTCSRCQMRGWILCNGKSLSQLLPRNADIAPGSSPLLLLAKRSEGPRWRRLRDNEAIESGESCWFPVKSEEAPCRADLWVARWRTACSCVWNKSGKVKWRSLAFDLSEEMKSGATRPQKVISAAFGLEGLFIFEVFSKTFCGMNMPK